MTNSIHIADILRDDSRVVVNEIDGKGFVFMFVIPSQKHTRIYTYLHAFNSEDALKDLQRTCETLVNYLYFASSQWPREAFDESFRTAAEIDEGRLFTGEFVDALIAEELKLIEAGEVDIKEPTLIYMLPKN